MSGTNRSPYSLRASLYSASQTMFAFAMRLLVISLLAARLSAEVIVTSMPSGMLQRPGGPAASDRFAVTNTGGAAVVIAVVSRGTFFVAPQTPLTLGPGETRVVELRALPSTTGAHIGFVSLLAPSQSEISVPVKLLVVEPPSVAVTLDAQDPRVLTDPRPPVISPPPPVDPVLIRFSNPSSVTVSALVVSDAAWLIPASDSVVLPAHGTATVLVNVNPAARPDAAQQVGSASGKVSLLFFGGPETASAAPPVTQVSAVIVHVNKAHVVAGTPPPLQISELAFFVGRFGGGVDLSLFARGSGANIRDLRLFYERAGMSQFSQLPAQTGISFVDLAGSSGSVQIRTPDYATLNLAAVKTSMYRGNAFSASIPIFTSNQGALPGGKIYLAGVAKDANTRTDVHLQEVSGHPASVRIDYVDARGSVVASNTESLTAFASAYRADNVPAGASTVIVSNDATSGGRVAAVALVTDTETGDTWPIREGGIAAGSPGDAFFVPVADERAEARTEIHVVNRGNEVALITIEVTGASPASTRRRTVSPSMIPANSTPVALASNASTTFTIARTAAGAYARINAAGGAVVASSRSTAKWPAGGAYGSAVPVVSESALLRAGGSRSFAGIEDAAAATVAARTPVTFRSELMLIETANAAATVRLTLQYTASTGLASARLTSIREVDVQPRSFTFVRPLAREIIGPERDLYGDLRNMVLTIEILRGSGNVIPVVRTIDNHSGDITIRGQ